MNTNPKRNASWIRPSLASVILSLAAMCANAQVVELAGAKFEPSVELGGQSLVLNGAAIRYKAIFKVYAVGLYVPTKTSVAKDVLTSHAPRRVQMTMLREVGGAELGRNFTGHFKDNATPEEVKNSIPQLFRFGELFATRKVLRPGDVFTLDWVPGKGTAVSLNGVQQGDPYEGAAFFSGMLKLWIGDADSAHVRDALLGQK